MNKEEFSKQLDCKVDEVIDFSSNINFVKPNINLDLNKFQNISYTSCDILLKIFAKKYKISDEQIEFYTGKSSAIFSLFRYLNLKTCFLYSPINLEYKKACLNFAYDLKTINRFDNLKYPIKENSLVVFENPTFPDGKYYNLEFLLDYWIEKNATILIDETFLDFCEGKSILDYMNNYDKIYILKSLNKFYSSEIISLNLLISNKKNIQNLKRFEPSNKISLFDVYYIQESSKDIFFSNITKALNVKDKLELEAILKSCILFEKVFISDINSILVKLRNLKTKELQEKLKTFKILIKDCSSFDFLDDSYLSFSVNSSSDNKKLKLALETLC